MKIEVNINKKHAYLIFSGLLILAGLFSVYAFGGNTPNIAGHSLGEIDFSGTIPNLNVTNLCLSGNCQNSWPEGAVSYWTQDGNTINYNGNATLSNSNIITESNLIQKIRPKGGYLQSQGANYYEEFWGVCSCATPVVGGCVAVSCPDTTCAQISTSIDTADGNDVYDPVVVRKYNSYACWSN